MKMEVDKSDAQFIPCGDLPLFRFVPQAALM